ncbi:hypothetical protein [Clostridium septicum]|uniref:hypothetical protein n=1 Tax=Clostridium septicum TaxID=1504 RepID=UPI0013E89986|nr:hypothetical protein [Clostridium septicum]
MKAIYNNNIKYCKIFSIDNMMDNFIKQYRSIDGEKYEKKKILLGMIIINLISMILGF